MAKSNISALLSKGTHDPALPDLKADAFDFMDQVRVIAPAIGYTFKRLGQMAGIDDARMSRYMNHHVRPTLEVRLRIYTAVQKAYTQYKERMEWEAKREAQRQEELRQWQKDLVRKGLRMPSEPDESG